MMFPNRLAAAVAATALHGTIVKAFIGRSYPMQRRCFAANAGPFKDINNMKKTKSFQGVSEMAPVVILVRTFLDQNIGATARAMLNFGIGELRLVDPQCDWQSDNAKARASGASTVLDAARVFPTVEDASADLHATFATTARLRDVTMEVITPQEMARRVIKVSKSDESEISRSDLDSGAPARRRCGLIFGPERSGLTNADVESVNALVQISTNPKFASLNLAQAVNICAFQYYTHRLTADMISETRSDDMETFQTTGGVSGGVVLRESETAVDPLLPAAPMSGPAVDAVLHVRDGEGLATKGEVASLMKRLEAALDEAGFRQHDSGTAQSKLRTLAGRLALSKREVSLLHGVVSALSGTGKFKKD